MADRHEPSRLPRVIAVRTGEDVAGIDMVVDAGLLWFQGHFPGAPILPGVVQIDWALAFARDHLGLAMPCAREFQIKFKAVIVPGDALTLALRFNPSNGRLGFDYRRGGEVCSTGQVFT
jgi:3-hydroxymyristoyl/3-hydroxydecanoyl-(acyl carrier protein) dehydratase